MFVFDTYSNEVQQQIELGSLNLFQDAVHKLAEILGFMRTIGIC